MLPSLVMLPPQEDLPRQLGLSGVGDVVLPDVAVQPVAEVQEPVVHADEDVGHDAGHLGEDPALHLEEEDANERASSLIPLVTK